MPNGTCSLSSCDREGDLRRGMCRRHYKLWREGLPLDTQPKRIYAYPPDQLCSVADCGAGAKVKGMCSTHWQRAHYGRAVDAPRKVRNLGQVCAFDACEKPSRKRGWCVGHYTRWLKHGDPAINNAVVKGMCGHPGCDRPHFSQGYCHPHARRARLGKPMDAPFKHYGKITTPCAVDGCDGRASHSGHCRRHWDNKRYALNPEPIKARTASRRKHMRALPPEDQEISAAYRDAIMFDPCAYCGGLNATDVDHVFPLAKGGTDHWWNLVRACDPCNSRKWAHCGTWLNLKRGSWLHVTSPRRVPAVAKAGAQHRRKPRKANKLLVGGSEIGQNYSLFDCLPDHGSGGAA